jgi:fructose-1,6-bisphosphatase
MVPDVHHILAKGGGVFCSPGSTAAPPKLRLLFEAAPMAFIVEAAGGASLDAGAHSLLVRAGGVCRAGGVVHAARAPSARAR